MLNYEVVAGNPAHISHYCVVLHGLGDSRHGWRPVAQELPVAGLGWVFVDAPEPYVDGYSWYPIPGMTSPAASDEDLAAGVRSSRAQLTGLLTHLQDKYQMGANRFLLMGFSQGCTMVLDQALRSDQAFAGVVGISGWIALAEEYPEAFGAAVRAQRLLVTHGRHDEVVPVQVAQAGVQLLQAEGLAPEFQVYDKGHSLDPQAELPRLRAFLQECMRA